MINIGGVNVVDEIIDMRYRMYRLELTLDLIVKKNEENLIPPTVQEMTEIDTVATAKTQIQFPQLQLRRKGPGGKFLDN